MTERQSLRIGDAEREAAIAALGEHYANGRITKDEYDERAGRAWTARFGADVDGLFSDLPQPRGGLAARPAPSGRRRPSWRPHPAMLLVAPLMVVLFGGLLFMIARGAPWLLLVFFFLWMCGGFGFGRRHARHPGPAVARWHEQRP